MAVFAFAFLAQAQRQIRPSRGSARDLLCSVRRSWIELNDSAEAPSTSTAFHGFRPARMSVILRRLHAPPKAMTPMSILRLAASRRVLTSQATAASTLQLEKAEAEGQREHRRPHNHDRVEFLMAS